MSSRGQATTAPLVFAKVVSEKVPVTVSAVWLQFVRSVSIPVLDSFSALGVKVAWPVVDVVMLELESNLVASDQLVCPEPPLQSVCVQGEVAAKVGSASTIMRFGHNSKTINHAAKNFLDKF